MAEHIILTVILRLVTLSQNRQMSSMLIIYTLRKKMERFAQTAHPLKPVSAA